MKNKKMILLLAMVLVVMFFSGCTVVRWAKYNSTEVQEFKKQLLSEHNNVKNITIKYYVPTVQIAFDVEKDITEEEILEIFYKTKTLLTDEIFQSKFFEAFFSQYTEVDSNVYPEASVVFYVKGNTDTKYEFRSFYYKNRDSVAKDIDGYNTWYYSNKDKQMQLPDTYEEAGDFKLN